MREKVELPVREAAPNGNLVVARTSVRSSPICEALIVKRLGPGLLIWNPLPDTMKTPTCGW